MAVHKLKCWPVYFAAVTSGEKPFEARRETDRVFTSGDIVELYEFDPLAKCYTGRAAVFTVGFVLRGPFVPEPLAVFALKPSPTPWHLSGPM